MNSGTCKDMTSGYVCTCRAGFTGQLHKRGQESSIMEPPGSFLSVFALLAGPNCQTNINECACNPCLNQGKCIDGVAGYKCNCVLPYTGRTVIFEKKKNTCHLRTLFSLKSLERCTQGRESRCLKFNSKTSSELKLVMLILRYRSSPDKAGGWKVFPSCSTLLFDKTKLDGVTRCKPSCVC